MTEQINKVLPAIADPAPLGLGGFALTTFVLSAHNAGLAPDIVWLGLGLFYGGLAQLLAGMWEFKNKNTFGATAFSTYGAFWLSLAGFVLIVLFNKTAAAAVSGPGLGQALGWFLLAFAIFNAYMLLASARINTVTFAIFLALELTEICLSIGFFSGAGAGGGLVAIGGYVGLVTAVLAWYGSAAGVINSLAKRQVLPVGIPLWKDSDIATPETVTVR